MNAVENSVYRVGTEERTASLWRRSATGVSEGCGRLALRPEKQGGPRLVPPEAGSMGPDQ